MNPTATFSPMMAQAPIANPTINSGIAAGHSFDGIGDDFLNPDKILGNVDGFSNSIKPITSNTWTSWLVAGNPYGKFADSASILKDTNKTINSIFNPNFGQNLNFTVPLFMPGAFALPVPDFGANPDPTRITLSTNFFTNAIQPNPQPSSPLNFNPLLWQSPSSMNVLLGSLQAQNGILGGSGFSLMA